MTGSAAADAGVDILIVDDNPENLRLLISILTERGYRVRAAIGGAVALRAARATPPDLVLLDIVLPDMDGFALYHELRADPRTADVPVIFLSVLHDTPEKVRAFSVGAADYITKPFELPEVLARVENQIARRRAEVELRASRARLHAIVDNAPVGVALLDGQWRVYDANRRWSDLLGLTPVDAARRSLLEISHPDDVEARRERLEALGRGEIARYHRETRLRHGDGGVFWADLLVAPVQEPAAYAVQFVAIVTDITERKRFVEALRHQAVRDPLTNLYNRRYMEEALERELRRAGRQRLPLGLIMLDLDYFKRFNDAHGHPAGDAMLRALADFLQNHVRNDDIVCRYGGEEFILILPESSLEDTVRRAEQLRVGVRELQVRYRNTRLEPASLSLGVAAYPTHGVAGDELLHAVDIALYAAKAAGRDRVAVAPPLHT